MRNIFTKLETTPVLTPTPQTCKKARAAYLAFCNGELKKFRNEFCLLRKQFAYGSPTCGKKCFNNAISTLESANIVIADPNSTENQKNKAEAEKKALPSLKILEKILKQNEAIEKLGEEKNKLRKAVEANKGCKVPKKCAGSKKCPDN